MGADAVKIARMQIVSISDFFMNFVTWMIETGYRKLIRDATLFRLHPPFYGYDIPVILVAVIVGCRCRPKEQNVK